jgi:signal transduction histidine kinase
MPAPAATARRLLFLLAGLPLGIVWFTLLVTGWSLAAGLLVTPLVVALFYLGGAATLGAGAVEAALARELLDAHVSAPRWPSPHGVWWRRLLGPVADASFWRVQAYLWMRALLGFALGLLTLALLAAALGAIAAPVYAWAIPGGLDYGVYTAHDVGDALPAVPVGLLLLAATIVLAEPMTRPFSYSSERLIGDARSTAPSAAGGAPAATGPATSGVRAAGADRPAPHGPGAPARPGPGGAGARESGLIVHATATALLSVVLVAIWALAGGGYFWPVWPLLALALALAIHAWLRLLSRRPQLWQRRPISHGLAVQAGVSASLALFFAGIWAAAGGGYFWPAWPILALAVALAIHAAVAVLGSSGRRAMSERIDVLETTRAGAVDAEEERLRTIERDLHDGAQARLVALGMSLGMAEQKLADAEPAAARELLAEARVGAEQALRELRDLARGIHPPVLTDRGLEVAVRSLADLSPIRVSVDADLHGERPPAAVESALYFVAAEGLANAAKHANARHVEIRMQRVAGRLRLDVIDDGEGGADPAGGGLSGLRRRVQALDGTLTVTSPEGGPTIVRAELPCA